MQQIIDRLFQARQVAHEDHLTTLVFARHIALGEFYSGVTEAVDEIAETYQGQYGMTLTFGNIEAPRVEIIGYLTELGDFLRQSRESVPDAHLQNLIDEVTALTYRTLYKVRFLS
jgi:hypothetical protein